MNKKKFAKAMWVSAVFLILIVILVAIIDYKVHYQYLTKSKLYFYECSGMLCVSEVEDNSKLLYSTYNCNYDICPIYKQELDGNHVLLEEKNNLLLYNYRTGVIISSNYEDYHFINNQTIIVTKNNKQGIIDINNKLIIEPIYEQLGYKTDDYITGYNLNLIIAKKNDIFGIVSYKTGEIIEPFNYTEEEVDQLLEQIKETD